MDDSPAPATPAPSPSSTRVPIFGARGKAKEALAEVETLRQQLAELGALDAADLQARERDLRLAEQQARRDLETVQAELQAARQAVVATREAEILQEVGVYDFRHPLEDSTAYRSRLEQLQQRIKASARDLPRAVSSVTAWSVNGSEKEGRAMVKDFSKLMLRAYNAEADTLVRGLKPYQLDRAVERLTKAAQTIERLGRTMQIRITREYHELRVEELRLTADYREMLAREKEEERAERERLREERKAQQEIERERERLLKERTHYENALAALVASGDEEGAARLREQIDEVARAMDDVEQRAANIRAGYVYVISNVGAFGPDVIKVGMTRRLEPMDRVKELGDASVPFGFDVHALHFSQDAVGVEAAMHARLADRRLNRVNLRREFFRATPAEARELLLELTGDLLHFEEAAEALEYHQSVNMVERAVGG